MVDVESLAPGLRAREDGVWVSACSAPVSFPSDAHAGCAALEDDSFWFGHRNAILLQALHAWEPAGAVFDVGGGNGCVTQALLQAGYDAVLLEPGPEGVRNAQARGIGTIICSTLKETGFKPAVLPAVGLFDVLEHIEDDVGFLTSLRQVMADGGRLYLTVPALGWLWSDADDSAGHCRRYTKQSVCQALDEAGFRLEYATYFFALLPLPILLFRTVPDRLRQRARSLQEQAVREHHPRSGLVRTALDHVSRLECQAVRRRRALPFGSSCLCVARA
jgi:SAM-dependent methyltransferase